MSITVAVNATDGANGPQAAVCQSAAQHNNCGDYNGGSDGGGGSGISIDGGGLGVGSVNGDAVVLNNERKDQRVRSVGARDDVALDVSGETGARPTVRLGTTFVDESSMCRLPAAVGCRRRSVFFVRTASVILFVHNRTVGRWARDGLAW